MDTQLQEEWSKLTAAQKQLADDRAQFEREKAAFEEERNASGVEHKLFVGNLGLATDEAAVTALFATYGSVKEVHMLKDRDGNSKRSCFVKFFNAKEAKAAIEALNGKHKETDARDCLAVRFAQPKGAAAPVPDMSNMVNQWNQQNPVQAQAASYDPYSAQQYNQFAGSYGPMMGHQQQQYAGGAYSMTAASATAPAASSSTGTGRGPPNANLYVNNLQPTATHQDVQAMFGDFGNVVSIKLFATSNGFQYGFVSFDDAKAASAAISALDGMDINGSRRNLEVRLKTDKGASRTQRFSPY